MAEKNITRKSLKDLQLAPEGDSNLDNTLASSPIKDETREQRRILLRKLMDNGIGMGRARDAGWWSSSNPEE